MANNEALSLLWMRMAYFFRFDAANLDIMLFQNYLTLLYLFQRF